MSNDLDISLLMRYQCYPTVKSVKVQETSFLDLVGFDVEQMVLDKYREVLSNPGYVLSATKLFLVIVSVAGITSFLRGQNWLKVIITLSARNVP